MSLLLALEWIKSRRIIQGSQIRQPFLSYLIWRGLATIFPMLQASNLINGREEPILPCHSALQSCFRRSLNSDLHCFALSQRPPTTHPTLLQEIIDKLEIHLNFCTNIRKILTLISIPHVNRRERITEIVLCEKN